MPRSGSTLLQNIMAQNPEFYVTPTSGLMALIFGARQSYTGGVEFKAQDAAAMKKAFLAFNRGGMEAYFRALTDRPCVLDKSRAWLGYYDLLESILGRAPKMICLVRDLRQVLASMEKRFRENSDKSQSIENHANLTGTNTFKRMMIQLQTVPVGLVLDRIIEAHHRGWNKSLLFLRYEDLTTRPNEEMRKVYEYLEVPFFQHDFSSVEQVTQEDDQVFGLAGLHGIRPKVEPMAKDYLDILGRDAIRHVETNYAWFFNLFGYGVTGK